MSDDLDDDSLQFESVEPKDEAIETDGLSNRETYNVVSDTVVGVNLRVKDNVIQAIAIVVSILLGAGIGALAVEEWIPGMLIGAFIGMVAGLFLSGFAIMIYRGMSHIRGQHD